MVRLLTGSTPAADRETILAEVAAGDVDLLIGTHSLIQEGVVFRELGLAVVDEQHRFGVHQRKSLREKGSVGEPDILVMTATPIPRTLAVTIYGDLDLSILDELPKGRRPITTTIAAGDEARQEAYELIRREVGSGTTGLHRVRAARRVGQGRASKCEGRVETIGGGSVPGPDGRSRARRHEVRGEGSGDGCLPQR